MSLTASAPRTAISRTLRESTRVLHSNKNRMQSAPRGIFPNDSRVKTMLNDGVADPDQFAMSILRSLFSKATEAPSDLIETDAEIDAATPQERRCRDRNNARPGTKVLIIDDSPTIVAALAKILASVHYQTYEAGDAESGIETARRELPELIFLDLVLPGMNGFAALRQMRRDPQLKHIPIIMISGNEQATEQFYANRIGADDFMKKPFARAEVFAKIEPLLDPDHVPRRKGLAAEEAASLADSRPSASINPPVAPVAPPVAPALAETTPPTPAAAPAPTVAAVAPTPTPALANSGIDFSALEARKELTAMGLQYFDQAQFVAAIKRGDRLAFELFIAGGGVDLNVETEGKTPLQVARENGRTQIFALLRNRLNSAAA